MKGIEIVSTFDNFWYFTQKCTTGGLERVVYSTVANLMHHPLVPVIWAPYFHWIAIFIHKSPAEDPLTPFFLKPFHSILAWGGKISYCRKRKKKSAPPNLDNGNAVYSIPNYTLATTYIQVWSELLWNWICLTLFVYHQSELVRRKVFAPESIIRCINMGNLSSLITWKIQNNSF